MANLVRIKFYVFVDSDDKEQQDTVSLSMVGPNGEYYLTHHVICEGHTHDGAFYWPKGYRNSFDVSLEKPMPIEIVGRSTLQVESRPCDGGDFGSWHARVWLDGFDDNGSTYQLILEQGNVSVHFDDDTQDPGPCVINLRQ